MGGFTIIHIKTPKKRGARISGLVMQTKVAQLICKYIIPQLEIVSITLIEWFNYVVHRIIWASIFFERKLLSRSFDRHLLKLYWLMKRVKKKNVVWCPAISGGRPLINELAFEASEEPCAPPPPCTRIRFMCTD